MPLPAHRRLTFEGIFGTLVAPVEEWSFRLNLGIGEGGGDPATFVDAAQAAYVANLQNRIRPVARLTSIKFASIGADGFYTGPPFVKEVDLPGTVTTSDTMPLQIAVAVTLTTARRGPTGRGRFYLPAPYLGVLSTNDGTMTATNAQNHATACAAFLSAINGPAGFGNVVIASTKGYDTPVTGVKVGRVPDTIRSRRTKLVEGYGATVTVGS